MKRLNLCLSIAWLFAGYSAIAAVADRFDYPIGNRERYTEAKDGDGWYSAQEFGEWNASFSKYHLGEDWNAESGGNTDCGLPVYAFANGTIVYAGIASGWGRVLIVRHTLPDGSQVESLYGHLGSFAKTSGDVARGEQVGVIGDGSEGGTTYLCHLHLELRTAACPNWGQAGPGYSTTPKPAGWTDPSDFVDSHVTLFAQPLADSVAEFSGVQGSNHWYYGYYRAPGLNPSSFTQLETFRPNPWGGEEMLWTHQVFAPLWTMIAQRQMHPSGQNVGVTELAVRRWVSPVAATVRITGFMEKSNLGGGDGVIGMIYADGKNVWSSVIAFNDPNEHCFDITTTLNEGDTVDFVLSPNVSDAYDGTVLEAKIVNGSNGPWIIAQPAGQFAQVGSSVTFSVVANGVPPVSFQWRKDGVNISGATSPTLILPSVGAGNAGGYSVVVWNAYGSVVSATAHLAVLADGANGNNPGQPAYPTPSPTEAGKDSLVFITHGRTPPGDSSNHPWVDDMKSAIKARVAPNWMVIGYKWTEQARAGVTEVVGRARDVGIDAGKAIVALGELTPNHRWERIHFIGHSAGARLVEEASRVVTAASSPAPTMHSTFLDPYTGVWDFGRSEYGKSSTWSDCYFSIDTETYDPLVGRTEGPIDHAYNVDVGWLDANKTVVGYSDSEYVVGGVPCGAISSHGWPHDYYLRTILNNLPACAGLYGYGLTMEAGGWGNRIDYPTGMSATPPCQSCPPPPMPSYQQPFRFEPAANLDLTSYGISLQGVVVSGKGATLTFPSGQPAPTDGREAKDGGPGPVWLAVAMPVTNGVNFVQFDAAFTSTNAAEGLLTVYWNTNETGRVDERFASPGPQTYRLALPNTVTDGLYTLSFRLDSFSAAASSLTVTNMGTGFAGITQPITLAMVAPASNGPPLLRLTAPTGFAYLVQSSTNLTSWTPTAMLVNTNGTVHFTDPAATNSGSRFYRAMLP